MRHYQFDYGKVGLRWRNAKAKSKLKTRIIPTNIGIVGKSDQVGCNCEIKLKSRHPSEITP